MLPVMENWKKQGDVLFTPLLHRLSLHAIQFVLHLTFNGLFALILTVVLPAPLTDDCTWSPVTAGAMVLFQIQQVVIGQEFPN